MSPPVRAESAFVMRIINAELLTDIAGNVKFLINESGIAFFPASQQHRDYKTHGMSYEDDYRGNALAGVVTPDRVEIRFHRDYSDDRVRNLWSRVRPHSEIASAELGPLFYQGRKIN